MPEPGKTAKKKNPKWTMRRLEMCSSVPHPWLGLSGHRPNVHPMPPLRVQLSMPRPVQTLRLRSHNFLSTSSAQPWYMVNIVAKGSTTSKVMAWDVHSLWSKCHHQLILEGRNQNSRSTYIQIRLHTELQFREGTENTAIIRRCSGV